MSTSDPNCVFCKIIAGQIPCAEVWRDEKVLAFLDIGPLSEGHLLVIPLDHHENLSQMPPAAAAALAERLPLFGAALRQALEVEGFNLLVNEGKVAGQEVMHVHFHLVPRRPSDGLGYRWNAGRYAEGRIEEVADRYKAALA